MIETGLVRPRFDGWRTYNVCTEEEWNRARDALWNLSYEGDVAAGECLTMLVTNMKGLIGPSPKGKRKYERHW